MQWQRGDATTETAEPATLVLRVEGPAAIEIQHLSNVILERVNRFFGWQAVGRIALRQAPLSRREATQTAARPRTGGNRAYRRPIDRHRRRRSAAGAGTPRRRHQADVTSCRLGGRVRHCHNGTARTIPAAIDRPLKEQRSLGRGRRGQHTEFACEYHSPRLCFRRARLDGRCRDCRISVRLPDTTGLRADAVAGRI